MTDKNGNTVEFTAIPTAELPKVAKSVAPETIALGTAILAVANAQNAAGDSLAYAKREDAVNRGAVLKRAVRAAGVPDGMTVGARVLDSGTDGDDRYRVAITLTPAKAKGK